MSDESNHVPVHLESTVALVRRGFPLGVPNEAFVPLAALLRADGEMSIRNVADVLSALSKKPPVEFFSIIDKVDTLSPEQLDLALGDVRKKLQDHGYEEWLLLD